MCDEFDNGECSSSEPNSPEFAAVEPETDGCISEPDPRQRLSTDDSIPETTRSSQSLDVAITVEVCDADEQDSDFVDGARSIMSYRSCLGNIPPVTISSHTSSPDDDTDDRKCVVAVTSSPTGDRSSPFTSIWSSPAAQSCGSETNPNFLSVSRTGTFSSGGSTRNCSRRPSSHPSVVEPQDIISVDIMVSK